MFALIVGVAPARIAGAQKTKMALDCDVLVIWVRLRGITAPVIPAGITTLM